MGISVTPQALDVLRRSFELARHDPSEVGVRLREIDGVLQPRFVAQPQPEDTVVEVEGVRIFVDARIAQSNPDAEIGVSEEHERLVVRPV